MLKNKYIDYICIGVICIALTITCLFMNGKQLGITSLHSTPGYETRLFNKDIVHRIDIVIEDWDVFLENADNEAYYSCDIIIDGEKFKNIGIRAKGNNSKRLTHEYGLDRYSLKIEFDHFEYNHYYGLDKFSLDSSFQDNSYMKTWIAFDMMEYMGVTTPLCSYTYVTVNNQDWGLFLAIEEPEEAFTKRNYGNDYGKLYKPDYKSLDDKNDDVALKYIDEQFDSYTNIFDNAKFEIDDEDKKRLIQSLKILDSKENLDTVINVDEVLRYFTVQVFVVNLDSYLGKTGHNYFLYEEDGILSMIPWDYNLAFATYSLGMPNPINDSTLYINYPIDTPSSGEVMLNRPMYHHIMQNDEYFHQYHVYFEQLISEYFESGYFEDMIDRTQDMISSYVKNDPTAFCSYEDYLKAVDTIKEFCMLRAKSIRGQLEGEIPSTIRGQTIDKSHFIDGSAIWLPDLGEIADLKD